MSKVWLETYVRDRWLKTFMKSETIKSITEELWDLAEDTRLNTGFVLATLPRSYRLHPRPMYTYLRIEIQKILEDADPVIEIDSEIYSKKIDELAHLLEVISLYNQKVINWAYLIVTPEDSKDELVNLKEEP